MVSICYSSVKVWLSTPADTSPMNVSRPCVPLVIDTINCVEFTRMVRTNEDSPNHFLPIIMITGHSERSRVNAARDAGVNEFLVKPVTAKGLMERLSLIVNRPRNFVKSKQYFGPDRRRRADPNFSGEERRKDLQAKA